VTYTHRPPHIPARLSSAFRRCFALHYSCSPLAKVTTFSSSERGKILVKRSGINNGSVATLLASYGSNVTVLTLPLPLPPPPQTFGLVSSVYATGRALMPAPLAGVAGSLEHRVTELSLPVISIVQDQSERVRRHAPDAGCISPAEPQHGT